MNDMPPNATPKVHPASREILPEDPLELHGHEVSGNPHLMMRMLVEEFARMGWGADAILQLACNPEYQAFRGLRQVYGIDGMRRRVEAILARCGVLRVTTTETTPISEQLVQLDLPA